MAGNAEELPPLFQRWIVEADHAALKRAQEALADGARTGSKRVDDLLRMTAAAQLKIARDSQRKITNETKKGADERVKATKAGIDREDALFKAQIRQHLADRSAANAKRLEGQQALNKALLQAQRQADRTAALDHEHVLKNERNLEREAHEKRLEQLKILGRKQLEEVRQVNRKILESDAQGNRHRLENHRQSGRKEMALVQGQVKKVLEEQAQGNRRALEADRAANRRMLEADRAANRETIANLNNAVRWEMQARSAANREKQAAQQAALRRQQSILDAAHKSAQSAQEAAQQKSINAHKAMWSTIRTLTETGSRFMSSITQSALQSMGTGVTRGLSHITSIFRREGNEQEAVLRSTYAQQEAITRRALVRQQGIVQGFQTRNAAVTQGGAGGGPVGAIMSIRNMLLGAGAFISARAIFGPIMDYQQTKIAFEGILQSGTAAQAMLEDLQNFAKDTPFTFAGISDSARKLLSVGYAAEDVIPMMTTLGNATAGLGLGEDAISGVIRALGQMKGKGKASAEELQQISEQMPGFSAIGAIAESMGISTAEAFDLMGQGAISADVAIEAILDGMERMPGAAGAMQRQSETLAGRLSTLKDTIQILLIDAMDPFIGAISDGVGVFTTFLDNLFNAGGVFKVARSAILGLAIALGSMLAFQGVVLMLDGIKLALAAIAANPAVVVFTGLVVAMTMLYRHVPRVTKVVDDMREAFGEFFSGTREALGLLMDGDFPGFVDRMSELGSDLMDALAPSVTVIRDFFMEAFDTARDWIEGGGMGDLWDTITETIATAADQIANSQAVEWLVEFGQKSWEKWQEWLDSGGLGDLADSIKLRILDALVKVKEGIESINWEQLLGPAIAIATVAIAGLLVGVPTWILIAGVAAVLAYSQSPRLRRGLREAFGNIGDWIEQKWKKITDGIDWTAVVIGALAAIEANTAKITEVIVGFIQSDAFVNAMITIALALGAILGAVVVGVIDGIIQATIDSWKSGDGILGRGFATQVFEDMILGSLHDMNIDGKDVWIALRDSLSGLGFLGLLFKALIWDSIGDLASGAIDAIGKINWGPVGDAIWGGLRTGIILSVFNLDWTGMWAATLTFMRMPFSEQLRSLVTWMMDELTIQFQIFTTLGKIIAKAIVTGLGFTGFGEAVARGIFNAINSMIDGLNDAIPDHIGRGPLTINIDPNPIPHLPGFAKGGLVTQPTVAVVGEAGPELIIPLDDKQRAIEVLAAAQLPSGWGIQPDVPGISQAIASTAAAIAPIGEAIQAATAPGMEGWFNSIDDLLERIDVRFQTWGFGMISLAGQIATSIVGALTTTLREGSREVATITRNYSRKLVDALNPLLTGIGEPIINLQFSERGNINTPRIAAPGDGPQVHVFNEGQAGRYGEAYIPFQPSNRGRSRNIADQAVRRLGGQVQWFEQGGITSQVPAGATLPGVSGNIAGLVTEFARRLSVWSLAHGGGYHVNSGYRSYARQAQLYHDYLAGVPGQAPAAPPGTSMHNFGLASDGSHWRNLNPEAFGLRYPMSYEPWHVEPVEGKGLLNGDTFPMFQPLPQPPDAGERGILSVVAAKAMQYTYDKVLAAASAFSMPGTSVGLGTTGATPEIMAAIRQAMSIVGVPGSWLGPLLTLISRESSFNPNAWNPRAVNGEHASGLMQTLPSTFWSNHLDPWRNIFGPVDNVIAGLRYILGRYGSIFNVGQAVSPTPTRGYSFGGVVDRDGIYRLAEGNRSEVVLPLENRGRLLELLRRTGLADTIAMAAGLDVASATSAVNTTTTTGVTSGPTIGNVIGEMHINSNAEDPNTVATLTAAKVDRELRLALSGF